MAINYITDRVRAVMRQAALQAVPAEQVDEVVDLACHAVQRALEAHDEVTKRASSFAIQITAQSVGLSLLSQLAPVVLDGLKYAAEAMGATVTEHTITLRPEQ